MREIWRYVWLAAVGCSRPSTPSAAEAAAPAPSIADAAAPATPEPVEAAPILEGFPWQLDLLDDAGKAKLGVVAVPLGAREPRPVVLALHGGSDRPEWACGAWRGIVDAYAFVVCPRGPGNDAALAWSSPADTTARIARALAATKRVFPGWVRDDAIVLVGFSMGATQAAHLAEREPATYRRIALAESAYAPAPVIAFAPAWSKGGGERAVFLCTTPGCAGPYRSAARNVAARGLPARLNLAGTTEHGMWDQVVRSMRRDWPWLVEGVPGWSGYVPPVADALPGKTELFDPAAR